MRKLIDDPRLMIKVCDLYYIQNMTQVQIAKTLDISRPTVSRLLAAAKEQGIVEISISNLEAIEYWQLERALEKEYKLEEVIIVDSASSKEEMKQNLGEAGARYLEYTIKDGHKVGLSMGSTIHRVVSSISNPSASGVTFVPLVGGLGQVRIELHANHLAEAMARIYQGDFLSLHAPARVSNALIRDELLKEESLSSVLQIAKQVDIAVVGIGIPNERSSIKATQYFKENEIESLINREVAGEICMQFYDINGNTKPYKNDNNTIGIDIEELRKVPHSIGIVGGIEKLSAIKGALKGGYINTLIIDNESAAKLLAKE
jgi:DNA-binding transcriptional regulator LsrR (DeoR family)